jgi:hypothetical protein
MIYVWRLIVNQGGLTFILGRVLNIVIKKKKCKLTTIGHFIFCVDLVLHLKMESIVLIKSPTNFIRQVSCIPAGARLIHLVQVCLGSN